MGVLVAIAFCTVCTAWFNISFLQDIFIFGPPIGILILKAYFYNKIVVIVVGAVDMLINNYSLCQIKGKGV